MGKCILEVLSREWAGTLHSGWRPAIDGTLNQTALAAREASTYPSVKAARADVAIVQEQEPEAIRIRELGTGWIAFHWRKEVSHE